MTELSAKNLWDLGGLALGGTSPYIVIDTDGLEDGADMAVESQDAWGDSTYSGLQRITDRQVTLTIGLRSGSTEAQRDALREVLTPRTNRQSKRVLRWRHRGVTKRVEYVPAPGKPLVMTGDVNALDYDYQQATVRLLVPDPVLYAETATVTPFTVPDGGYDALTVDNDGSLACVSPGSVSLGAWSWEIVAGIGGCTWPYVQNLDFTGEFWMLQEVLDPGDIVTVDPSRVTRVNGARRHATVVGPGGCPVPIWPVLRPGENSLRVGCFDGTAVGDLTTRPTW